MAVRSVIRPGVPGRVANPQMQNPATNPTGPTQTQSQQQSQSIRQTTSVRQYITQYTNSSTKTGLEPTVTSYNPSPVKVQQITPYGPVTIQFTPTMQNGQLSFQPSSVSGSLTPITKTVQSGAYTFINKYQPMPSLQNGQLVLTPVFQQAQVLYNNTPIGTITPSGASFKPYQQPIYWQGQLAGYLALNFSYSNGTIQAQPGAFTPHQVTATTSVKYTNPYTGQTYKVGYTAQVTPSLKGNQLIIPNPAVQIAQEFPNVYSPISLSPMTTTINVNGTPEKVNYNVYVSPTSEEVQFQSFNLNGVATKTIYISTQNGETTEYGISPSKIYPIQAYKTVSLQGLSQPVTLQYNYQTSSYSVSTPPGETINLAGTLLPAIVNVSNTGQVVAAPAPGAYTISSPSASLLSTFGFNNVPTNGTLILNISNNTVSAQYEYQKILPNNTPSTSSILLPSYTNYQGYDATITSSFLPSNTSIFMSPFQKQLTTLETSKIYTNYQGYTETATSTFLPKETVQVTAQPVGKTNFLGGGTYLFTIKTMLGTNVLSEGTITKNLQLGSQVIGQKAILAAAFAPKQTSSTEAMTYLSNIGTVGAMLYSPQATLSQRIEATGIVLISAAAVPLTVVGASVLGGDVLATTVAGAASGAVTSAATTPIFDTLTGTHFTLRQEVESTAVGAVVNGLTFGLGKFLLTPKPVGTINVDVFEASTPAQETTIAASGEGYEGAAGLLTGKGFASETAESITGEPLTKTVTYVQYNSRLGSFVNFISGGRLMAPKTIISEVSLPSETFFNPNTNAGVSISKETTTPFSIEPGEVEASEAISRGIFNPSETQPETELGYIDIAQNQKGVISQFALLRGQSTVRDMTQFQLASSAEGYATPPQPLVQVEINGEQIGEGQIFIAKVPFSSENPALGVKYEDLYIGRGTAIAEVEGKPMPVNIRYLGTTATPISEAPSFGFGSGLGRAISEASSQLEAVPTPFESPSGQIALGAALTKTMPSTPTMAIPSISTETTSVVAPAPPEAWLGGGMVQVEQTSQKQKVDGTTPIALNVNVAKGETRSRESGVSIVNTTSRFKFRHPNISINTLTPKSMQKGVGLQGTIPYFMQENGFKSLQGSKTINAQKQNSQTTQKQETWQNGLTSGFNASIPPFRFSFGFPTPVPSRIVPSKSKKSKPKPIKRLFFDYQPDVSAILTGRRGKKREKKFYKKVGLSRPII